MQGTTYDVAGGGATSFLLNNINPNWSEGKIDVEGSYILQKNMRIDIIRG